MVLVVAVVAVVARSGNSAGVVVASAVFGVKIELVKESLGVTGRALVILVRVFFACIRSGGSTSDGNHSYRRPSMRLHRSPTRNIRCLCRQR